MELSAFVRRIASNMEAGAEVTQKQCQAFFETYNQRFFGGRLPAYRIVLTDRGPGFRGLWCKKEREIHLRMSLQGMDLRRTLLHEMAHASVRRGGHGKVWLAEMLRLAELGAPTREDWQDFQDKARTTGLRDAASEAYQAGLEGEFSWGTVRNNIGMQYGWIDERGRSLSKSASKAMLRCWKEFRKGRRRALSWGLNSS
jgi:hypothetical protein